MQLVAVSALVALLLTPPSGNALSTQAAGCNSKIVSSSKQLSGLNTHEVCMHLAGDVNDFGPYISEPFNISSTSILRTAGFGMCMFALDLLLEKCDKEGLFYGGSVEIQGTAFTIEEVQTTSAVTAALQTRQLPQKKKPASPKESNKKPAAIKPGPKGKVPSKKAPKQSPTPVATPKKSPAPTPSAKARQCKKKAPKSAKPKALGGRGLLFELIRHGALDKRTEKQGKMCQQDFPAGEYPKPADVMMKQSKSKLGSAANTPVLKYAFADCDDVESWSYGQASPQINKGLDTEHILEWQTVTGFFNHLDKKISPTGAFCKSYDSWKQKIIPNIETENFEKVSGTLNDLIKRTFPSNNHHAEEFVLLEHRANSPAKVNLFSKAETAMTDSTFQANVPTAAINNLRAFLAVGLYFSDTRIYTTYGNQASRISRVLGRTWAQLKTIEPNAVIGPNWQKEWIVYMDAKWAKAQEKLVTFFHTKTAEMDKKLGCSDAAQRKKNLEHCEMLKDIKAAWKNGVKEKNLEKLSYDRSEGSAVDGSGDTVMDDARK